MRRPGPDWQAWRHQPQRRPIAATASGLPGGWRAGEGVEFGAQVRGLGCADPLEDLQGLAQEGRGLGGVAGGQGAAAQAGQGVRLVPGAGDGAGLWGSKTRFGCPVGRQAAR